MAYRNNISRRDFLKAAGALGLIAASGSSLEMLTSCGPKAKPGQELKIGAMTPSTGTASDKGIPGEHGLYDAIEYINAELNGAAGYPINLNWQDSHYDMPTVVNIVNDFINKGCLMFTTHSSTEMKGAQGTANEAGFPGIATFSSTVNLHPPLHIYSATPDYGDDWIAFTKYYMANLWKGTGKPKMALHALQGTTGQGMIDASKAMADTLGVEIVDTEIHTSTTIDETESLTRIMAQNPDVMVICSIPAPTAVVMKAAKQVGLYPAIPIGCCSASYTSVLINLAGADIVEGVYGVCHTVSWDENVAGMAKAKEYCQKNHPSDYGNMDYFTTWATCLVVRQILTNAVNNVGYDKLTTGNAASWKLIEDSGIKKLNNYDVQGLQGKVSYTVGDNRLGRSLRLYRIKNGIIGPISDWQEAPLVKYEDYSWFGK